MRNYNETDKIIKDKLGQYDSGAPMHLFDRIEEGLGTAPKRKKRGGMWWTFGLLLMMVVGTSWYLVGSQDQPIEEQTINASEIEASKIVKTTSSYNNTNTSNSIVTNTKEKEVSTTINKVSKKGLTSNKAITTKNTVAENKIINTRITDTDITIENHQVINEEQFVSETQQHSSNELFSKGKISTDSPFTQSENQERKSILTAQNLDGVFERQVPTLVDLNIKYNSEFQLPDIVKCGNKKDRKLNFNFSTSMDLFASPERSFRFLEYKSDDYAEHAIKRNETEKAYYSFSSGLRLNFLNDNGLAIRTGLVYSQINEIFEDQLLVQELLINPISGDTVGFTQYLNDVTTFNRYKMVDIPLTVGYEMPMKRSTLNVNAGIFVNVKATQKGNLLDEEGTKRDFTTGSGDYQVFRKNIGISYFMSLGAAYELTPQYQFFFEPHLRYYPGSFAKKEYALNQKYVTGGIMLGIRKKL